MKIRALDVSEANSYIKRILINDPILYNLRIKGEVSNLKLHSSGNVYLSLKDQNSKINCVVFKSDYDRSLNLENGTKIIASGYISVYERDGSYQLYIKNIEVSGIGNLYIEFNKLKEKLQKEGLFDYKYKKPIPKIPTSIGVVTSPTGAVIRDIINVTTRRYPKVHIKLYPVKVQGQGSKEQICEGINFFNKKHPVDTIIVGRGGGSIEDLWSFNEEEVARCIFESKIPIISAVGHETDFTICDFVADMRAPTPSAAAEIATPDIRDLYFKLDNIRDRMNKSLNNAVEYDEQKLKYTFTRMNTILNDYIINNKIYEMDKIIEKINLSMENKINKEDMNLKNLGSLLHNLSPLKTLDRGYSIINKENVVVNSISNVSEKDKIEVILSDGSLDCTVDKINKKEV
ncbi:MAG: exodeoxyribonuclease VII large subunit [Intestinibacter sp.]|uniref:exodeoxyribonuclease VII large subunit n=2 Tax=Intestinibacter sp. TaxID=1965304 RepID=UPI0025C6260C|nr:exodeoxyribonuclease VII large subunit [Intestinibacter sp.]MCI6737436.1 exodeoxyribonuclease VII large subunit [Intestinibacter sp.]